jgi:hypothetical protein
MYKKECYLNKSWIIIIFFILVPIFLFSQVTTSWVVRYDGPVSGEDILTSMVVDIYGNVYVTGWSYGIHYEDYATIEYDTEGNELWVARYNHPYNGGDCALALAVDSSSNVYVTGLAKSAYAIGTIKYDGNGNVIWENIHEPPYWDNHGTDIAVDAYGNIYVAAFCVNPEAEYKLIKYDDIGNITWERSYSPPYIEFPVLAIDNQNNVFIAGASWRNYPSAEYIVIKYDETGTELWRKFYNDSTDSIDFVNAIVVDDSGNVYVTGQSMGIASGYDYATIKYDIDGSQLWVARYNGSGNDDDRANAIIVDNLGNLYVTGISDGDYATVKYDSAGSEQWVATYDGLGNGLDEACSIVLDDSNNIYITGKSGGSGTGYDYATIKYDSAGIEQWVVRYDGLGNGSDEAYSIALDSFNNVYVAGKSMGSGTDYDFATIKYEQVTATNEEIVLDQISFMHNYPNPFNPSTTITFSLTTESTEHTELVINNLKGQKVKQLVNEQLPTGQHSVTWNGTDEKGNSVSSGIYFYELESGKFSETKRMLLLK